VLTFAKNSFAQLLFIGGFILLDILFTAELTLFMADDRLLASVLVGFAEGTIAASCSGQSKAFNYH
jgi:hypothetical protein